MDLIIGKRDMILVDIVPNSSNIHISRRETGGTRTNGKGRRKGQAQGTDLPLLQLNLLPISPCLRSDELLEITDCVFRAALHPD
jgi:hypothetical protein